LLSNSSPVTYPSGIIPLADGFSNPTTLLCLHNSFISFFPIGVLSSVLQ